MQWIASSVRDYFPLKPVIGVSYLDDFPKPVITRQPVSQIALKEGLLNLTCQAVASSDSPLTIIWKKDHAVNMTFDFFHFFFVCD
jgi:hypothetical protein